MTVKTRKPGRKAAEKPDTRTKSRGFPVNTGVRAGSVWQDIYQAVPPILRSYG